MALKTHHFPAAEPNSPLYPREIFKHAMQFANTDNFLRQIMEKDAFGYVNMAAIVVNAFAIELFLKCIIVIDDPTMTKERLKAHNLWNLFDKKVSPTRQAQIIDLWNNSPAIREIAGAAKAGLCAHGGEPFSTDLPTALRHCKDAFQELRYIYEGAGTSAFYIWRLTRVLYDCIASIHPEWTSPDITVPVSVDLPKTYDLPKHYSVVVNGR